jgi:bacterioferritin-associated ferredoxin
MYACICRAVSTTSVEYAVLGGAASVEQVGEATGAGTGCGSCHDVLGAVIDRIGCPLMALRQVS